MNLRSVGCVAVVFGAGSVGRAEDKWFELKDFGPVTQRVGVTVENPADVAVEAAVVHLPLKELQGKLQDAKEGQIAVVDPETKPAKREAADQNFVPAQVSGGTL